MIDACVQPSRELLVGSAAPAPQAVSRRRDTRENATESDLPLTLFLLADFRRASINRKDQTGMWTMTLTPPKQSSVFVDPKEACLLLIDFYEEQDSARSEPRGAGASHEELLRKAVDLKVPSFLSFVVGQDFGGSDRAPQRFVPEPTLVRRSAINPWKDESLRRAILDRGRHRLVLAGGWPDGSLAQAALAALEEGYDVYVLFDLCDGLLDQRNSPVAARLMQAGVVPLTARQLILEWSDAAGGANDASV